MQISVQRQFPDLEQSQLGCVGIATLFACSSVRMPKASTGVSSSGEGVFYVPTDLVGLGTALKEAISGRRWALPMAPLAISAGWEEAVGADACAKGSELPALLPASRGMGKMPRELSTLKKEKGSTLNDHHGAETMRRKE